jgi:hypothetical protein
MKTTAGIGILHNPELPSENSIMLTNPAVLQGPRPLAITKSELTAGLRRRFGDSRLVITGMEEISLLKVRPAAGRIRSFEVVYQGGSDKGSIRIVVKEPHTSTRNGTAGAGKREAAFYTTLADHVPLQTPELLAADRSGRWLALELFEPLREVEDWQKDDYLLAVDSLAQLHDRFWGLSQDLTVYPWLSRQLIAEKQIYQKTAWYSLGRIQNRLPTSLLSRDKELIFDLERLVEGSGKIAAALDNHFTLLHGDYWPGNLCLTGDESLAVIDWQQTGVGPGILDLVSFVQNSLWWFSPLPCEWSELVERYRSSTAKINGCIWKDGNWVEQWEYGLMWKFLSEWMLLLSEIPEPVLETNWQLLEEIWLEPVRKAIAKRL